MSKYIDAEKLIAEIEKRKYEIFPTNDGKVRACSTPNQMQSGWLNALTWMLRRINSLQHEQQEPVKGKFVFPNFLYARTVDNKTIDMSYAPQSLDAIEYIRKDIVDETIKTAEDHAYFAGQEKFREKLIEWAKENIDSLGRLSYGELIDKLNSL